MNDTTTTEHDGPAPVDDLLEYAWTIICNAGGGDWTKETPEWQGAAVRFREQYHDRLATARTP